MHELYSDVKHAVGLKPWLTAVGLEFSMFEPGFCVGPDLLEGLLALAT